MRNCEAASRARWDGDGSLFSRRALFCDPSPSAHPVCETHKSEEVHRHPRMGPKGPTIMARWARSSGTSSGCLVIQEILYRKMLLGAQGVAFNHKLETTIVTEKHRENLKRFILAVEDMLNVWYLDTELHHKWGGFIRVHCTGILLLDLLCLHPLILFGSIPPMFLLFSCSFAVCLLWCVLHSTHPTYN